MATLRDSLAEYRELNAPLQRSMRRWWQGAGCNWLLAIGALGFFSICLRALANLSAVSGPLDGYLLRAAMLDELLLVFAVIAACVATVDRRMASIRDALEQAAIPRGTGLRSFAYQSGLFSAWPALAILLAYMGLRFFVNTMQSQYRTIAIAALLIQLQEQSQFLFGILFNIIVLAALHCLVVNRWLRLTFSAVLLFHYAQQPLEVFLPLHFYRGSEIYLMELDHLAPAAGSLLAVLALAASLWLAGRSHALAIPGITGLALLRSLSILADYRYHYLAVRPLLHTASLLLQGFQRVFTDLPFSCSLDYVASAAQARQMLSLQCFWQATLAIPTGPSGYVPAALLNLLWLFLVFLFCRRAVGRSAGREN